MPYIKKSKRMPVIVNGATGAGELNYEITMVINRYLTNMKESYQTYNDIIGALEGCKLEIYRRLIVPYEAEKIKENGDVYG